jgi:hypothetical protein
MRLHFGRSLLLCMAAAFLIPAGALGLSVGVGVFGGASIPVIQDDAASGTQFGVRVPVHPIPLLTIEPFYARSGLGDVKKTFGGIEYTRTGFDLDTFGVNVALGGAGLVGGLPFYPYVGIMSQHLKRPGTDRTEVGYAAGLGLGLSVPMGIAVTARGEFNLLKTGDTSRKFANVTLGVSKTLTSLP